MEEIREFARVFAAGKRRGGELDRILNLTVSHMKQKQETEMRETAERQETKVQKTAGCQEMKMQEKILLIMINVFH